jgi:hypothetical protein
MIAPLYFRSFKLGSLYESYLYPGRILKFIKVTRKGYNLLDIETNKCILNQHLYSRDFSNKEIPETLTTIKNVAVRNWLTFKEVVNIKEI